MLPFSAPGRQMKPEIACFGELHYRKKRKEKRLALLTLTSYTTKAFGPIMAKAATLTIVEAENIVPVGSIDANDVDLPGIFVNRIVPAADNKHIEIKKLRSDDQASKVETASGAALMQRNRIARRAAKELKQGYYVNLGVGIPTLAPSFLDNNVKVWVQSENGILGMVSF